MAKAKTVPIVVVSGSYRDKQGVIHRKGEVFNGTESELKAIGNLAPSANGGAVPDLPPIPGAN